MERKLIKKTDIIAVCAVLAACLIFLGVTGLSSRSLTATVTVNGSVLHSVSLGSVKEPYELTTPTDPETVILISPDGIEFKSSGCDNQLCVKSGKLTRKGAAAVCLPARVVITLTGQGGVDAITY